VRTLRLVVFLIAFKSFLHREKQTLMTFDYCYKVLLCISLWRLFLNARKKLAPKGKVSKSLAPSVSREGY